ncbi:excalibur calcium-binding domain-containing protein [Bisgaard Taxon 10/6]|nr:excalibur calcium-binding domain-containing protein [Exercitatus varius]
MKKYFFLIILCSLCSFSSAKEFDCSKNTCKEMDSCSEARYHLEQCGLSRLDRDNDGIPCESICGGNRKKKK